MIGVFLRHVNRVPIRSRGSYTGFVAGKHAPSRSALAEALREIRGEARLSQAKLASLAGVSLEPIKGIETEGHRPKAETLRKLADGAATNGAGHRNREQADGYYDRLMKAAGYVKEVLPLDDPAPLARRPVDDLTDEEVEDALERYSADPEAAVAFLSAVKRWQDMSPSARRLVLFSLEEARRMDEEIERANRQNRRDR